MLASLRNLSWQVTAVLGLAVLAVALQLSKTGQDIEGKLSLARAAGQPKAVMLADFNLDRDVHTLGEVNVIVRLDPRQMITITGREKNSTGAETAYVRRLFILQDPGDRSPPGKIRAAVLLPDAAVGRFLDLVGDTATASGKKGLTVTLNGVIEAAPRLGTAALAELAAQGLPPTHQFMFLMPFLDGRDTALAPRDGSWRRFVTFISMIGAGMMVLAIAKRVRVIKGARDLHGVDGGDTIPRSRRPRKS